MDGFKLTVLAVFQYLCVISSLGYFVRRKYFQNLYPGCKTSPDQPDMSYPVCSESEFLQKLNGGTSDFKEFAVNTTRLYDCLRDPRLLKEMLVVEGFVQFRMPLERDAELAECWNKTCYCPLRALGPPGTYFLVTVNDLDVDRTTSSQVIVNDGTRLEKGMIFYSHRNMVTFLVYYTHRPADFMSFDVSFQAFPECQRQLQLKCLSVNSGSIETPGWNESNTYLNDIDSCVTLHVPEDHVTMISLTNIDLERDKDSCVDVLYFYKSENCTGPPERAICKLKELLPTVVKETSALSFRFVSDHAHEHTGFRLLYSFHNTTEEPSQLSDGKWDCTVPYYSSFEQHFICIAETFCADKRDQVACPDNSLCGHDLVTFGGSCYRVFSPSGLTTWAKASDTCENSLGSLAVLKGASELSNAVEFIKDTSADKYVFVGLKIASLFKLHDMYQYTWLWSDSTLAVYLPITFNKVSPPYCAAVKDSNLTMVRCDEKMPAAFLCETDFTRDNVSTKNSISLPSPSGWNTSQMLACRQFYFTHSFLACDSNTRCLVEDQDESVECSDNMSPPVPVFTCRNRVEHVPYTLVCDFRSDCCDDSDEDFCEFAACGNRMYTCANNKQCISARLLCDKRSDCLDGSDEFNCQDVLLPSELLVNTVEPPALVDFTGNGYFTVTQLINDTCPETHFQCPGGGYCLPVYVRCNGFYDCPGKEDEEDCDHYTCPGFYRCRKSKICLHEQHLCDGMFQCPERDDELMCNFTCPENCHCYGHAFTCSESFIAGRYPELRYVDASGTGMNPEDFENNTKLIFLRLRKCGIKILRNLYFPNLHVLDLGFNDIQELDSKPFEKMKNLYYLTLAYNSFMPLDSFLYSGAHMSKIIHINLSGIPMPHLLIALFDVFPNIRHLNLSGSGLKSVGKAGFQPLNNLRMLDLRGCPVDNFFPGVFEGLIYMKTLYADNYKLCCPAVLPKGLIFERCYVPFDEISSCDALLRTDIFRVFLAVYAILALAGNIGSFVYRVCIERSCAKLGYEVFVSHLSIADFFMGVYLAIIGIADRHYYGNYLWKDVAWTHSVVCKVAGFLSLTSNVVSAYILCLITLERFLVIGFPHRNLRFSRLSAHLASFAVWLIGLTLAAIPLLPVTSHWEFYSQSGICIPLPITRKEFGGSDYAFAVMIVMNFVLFLFIAVGQLLIYRSIRVNSISSSDCGRSSRDTTVAHRLLAVVMTDFLCFFPICLLGLMAREGVPISSDISVVMAIFVLPFNSALNPFLYTLNIVMERRRKENQRQCRVSHDKALSQKRAHVFDVVSESRRRKKRGSEEEAFQVLRNMLEDGMLTPERIRQHISEMYEG